VQVLLSCSHSFHKTCLDSFERFGQAHCCPVCRAVDYQKKCITDGRDAYLNCCATLIQAFWRGHAARLQFWQLCAQRAPACPTTHRAWVKARFQWQARRLHQAIASQGDELAALFAECDQALSSSRPVFDQATAMLSLRSSKHRAAAVDSSIGAAEAPARMGVCWLTSGNVVHWKAVLDTARLRGQDECPICMGALARGAKSASCILSCSHCFHEHCIEAFERFEASARPTAEPICPVCRAEYIRQQVHVSV
jgi:Ring finger domain/IQ calmodulin-binding motif